MAQQVLTQFQENPDAWTRVPDILERSSFPQTKVRVLRIACRVYVLTDQIYAVYRAPDLGEAHYNEVEVASRGSAARSVSICDSSSHRFMRSLGIRNFVVGITVKVASDEATMRREKTYLNKLNLALVQVWLSQLSLLVASSNGSVDPQTGVATQLADLHHGASGIVQDEPVALREQHGHPQAIVRGDLRLLSRTDDSSKSEASEEPNVWRVLGNLQALLGNLGGGTEDLADQGHSRDTAEVLELDSPRVYLRDNHHRSAT